MNESHANGAIRLDQFLKLHGAAQTGGHAKRLIQNGEVRVNGQVELRRGRQLQPGDIVETGGREHRVSTE